jgi:hypothetical protein
MAISNELSSEIAAAILTPGKTSPPQSPGELQELILLVHLELQRMSEHARTDEGEIRSTRNNTRAS